MTDPNDLHPLYTPEPESLVEYVKFVAMMDVGGLILACTILVGIWLYWIWPQDSDK